ncbi:MAG TPA: FtsX-like permease family protein [Ilumatobacter sp.]|nr:FtsX-like permease family protein [Ilumatobacter sp.]
MSVIPKLARRSLRARIGRAIAIALAILASVAFVSGSFILADSLKATFDNLFTELTADVDLEVRSVLTVDDISAARDPVPASLEQTVNDVPGVAVAEGALQRTATLLQKDGDAVDTRGAPALGVSWSDDPELNGVTLKEGRAPAADDEVVIDKLTADNNDYEVGDDITIVFDNGPATFRIVGLVGLGDTDGFGGATIASFAHQYAQQILDAGDTWDVIDMRIEEGADLAQVQAAVEQVLPARTEVVTGEQVSEEASDSINEIISIFGNILLTFAFVTAFVAAFIINNVFGITIGQRLRELALMRGIGASTKQVRRLIVLEALLISVTATVLGILAGFAVAKGMITIFNASGAGFPSSSLILRPPAVIVSLIVGVGVTMASVVFPARRAAKVPPVAAMRPEIGFAALSSGRRLVIGAVVTIVGAVMFVLGLFVRPGGTIGLIALAGGGALLIFIGVASLSMTVARPVAGAIGRPIEKVFGTPGKIARDNAMRSPRRTARTASALMIGVALISAAALFTSSVRDTFGRILDRSVTADFIVSNPSFLPIPAEVAERIAALPDIRAVSPVRPVLANIDSDQIAFSAIDPVAFPELVDVDVTEGGFDAVTDDDGAMVFEDEADDLGVGIGDPIAITFSNGVERDVTVAGIFEDNSLGSPLWISLGLLEQVSDLPPSDQLVLARAQDGVDPDTAKLEIEQAVADFPQAEVQTNAEFRQDQEGQINQLLVIISVLLGFAILISFFGIAITLALSVFERTREIGLLRAVGMNRRQLRRAVRWEAVIVSIFGVVIGVVVGTLIGIALSYAVPDNFIDGVTIPWGVLIIVVVLAVVAAVVAALYPAYKASRMNVLEAIATE